MSCVALIRLKDLDTSQLSLAAEIATLLDQLWKVYGLPDRPLTHHDGDTGLAIYFPGLDDDVGSAYGRALRALLDARTVAQAARWIGTDGWDQLNTVQAIHPEQITYEKKCVDFPGGQVGLRAHRAGTAAAAFSADVQGTEGLSRGDVPSVVVSTPGSRLVPPLPSVGPVPPGRLMTPLQAVVTRGLPIDWLAINRRIETKHTAEKKAAGVSKGAAEAGREAEVTAMKEAEQESKLEADAAPADAVPATTEIRKGDSYLARLTKYIPAEITGIFIVVATSYLPWIFADALVCWLLTPVYVWLTSLGVVPIRRPRWYSYVLSFAAFPFWALAVDSALGTSLPFGITIVRGQAVTMMMFAAILIPGIATAIDTLFPRQLPPSP